MRKFGNRGREHACNARIYCISAVKIHTHARLCGILAAGGHPSPGSPRGMHRGLFHFLPLCHAGYQRAEKKKGKLRLHRASLIITSRLLLAWLIMVQSRWTPKKENGVKRPSVPATMSQCFFVPAATRG